MRFSEFIKTPSFAVAVVFILAALVASKISSPWRDGPLLTLKPALPEAIARHAPLIQWPEAEQDTTDFRFDLGLDAPLDAPSKPEEKPDADAVKPSKARDTKPSKTLDESAAEPPGASGADEGEPSKAPEAEALKPSKAKDAAPIKASETRAKGQDSKPVGAAATQDAEPSESEDEAYVEARKKEFSRRATLVHQRMLARFYGPTSAGDTLRTELPARHKTPSKPIDPRDKKLLESIKKLRANLPSRKNFLHIPCTDGELRPPGSDAECTQRALDNFYASLRDRAFGKSGHTRWMQYGDSLVIGDTMTGELRRLFQQQFGDGGHGWVYIGHPLRPVRAENIRLYPNDAWYIRTIVRHSENGGDLFGLGGAEFRPTDDSSLLLTGAREKGLGHTLERFHLYYFAPSGVDSASFHLTVNGQTHTEHIVAKPGSSNVHTFEVPPGNHRIQLSGFSSKIRYYGLVSESSGPGVVIDNLGLVSARQEHLLKLNKEQWHDQLALRDPDVVAFFYGVNAASSNKGRAQARSKGYIQDYKEVIRRAMRDAPNRDCVILSLLTRGTREGNKIYPTGAVEVLNKAQKDVALASGCAFFDTTGVMGGSDGIQAWANHRPPLLGTDLSHPTRPGHHRLARQLYANLIDGFIEYMERRVTRGGDTQ